AGCGARRRLPIADPVRRLDLRAGVQVGGSVRLEAVEKAVRLPRPRVRTRAVGPADVLEDVEVALVVILHAFKAAAADDVRDVLDVGRKVRRRLIDRSRGLSRLARRDTREAGLRRDEQLLSERIPTA